MKPALILLALTSIAFAQGNLTPPGAPGLTMKSLDQIEPRIPLTATHTPGNATCVFRITQPGSYYLPGNLKPPAGKHGILIALLVPGVVKLDLMGFTVDGSDAGATASAMIFTNDTIDRMELSNGTISNFAGTACLQAAPTGGTFVFHDIIWLTNGTAVNTPARLLLSNSSISGGSGIPLRMGSDSVLSGVEIIQTSQGGTITEPLLGVGGRMHLEDISLGWSLGVSNPASVVVLGPGSTISGMTARISGGTFTGPLFTTTGGFTEVSGLNVELTNVTAPSVCVNYLGQSYDPTRHRKGTFQKIDVSDLVIAARNCTFSQAIVRVNAAENPMGLLNPGVKLEGATTAPLVVGADGNGLTVAPRISIGTSATLTGPVVNVAGNGNTVSATIRGVPAGGTGILLSSGQSCHVTGCVIAARGDGPATAVQLSPLVFKALCDNEMIRNFPPGSVIVDNQGGASNAVAPIRDTAAAIAGNTNPFAIIVH